MLYAIVAVLALIVDQALKYWTTVNIVVDSGRAKLIPGFIRLVNLHNTGAAFSILEGARWFFVILCILFCLLVVYLLVRNIVTNKLARWMAVIIMAGAVGNCIDRVVCGFVVDMLEFEFLIFGRSFPVFNIADIYITVGAIVFCLCILLEKPKAARKNVPFAAGNAAEPREAKPAHGRRQHTPAVGRSAAQTEAKPAHGRRQRPPLPDFPKHAPAAEPKVDPADPFAEWETQPAASGTTVYSQPAAAQKNYSKEAVEFVNLLSETEPAPAAPTPAPEVKQAPEPPAPVAKPAPAAKPAAPAEVIPEAKPAATVGFEFTPPAQEAKPAAKKSGESFDLDDILAEFRDL